MLFSAWPSHLVSEVGAPPSKIDAGILASLKRSDIGGYASFPRKTRRNQFEDTRAVQRAHDTLSAPRFLSERQKDDLQGHEGPRRMSDALEALGDLALAGATRRDVPVMYRNVEIKYSKFGVDDFDFEWVLLEYLGRYVTDLLQVL
jgi:PAB-dependent poly(A)-specific ribonuclease subunit 2